MWKKALLLGFVSAISLGLKAQYNNSYTVSDSKEFDKVKFSLNVTNGRCFIERGNDTVIMAISSDSESDGKPDFQENIVNRTKEIHVKMNDEQTSSLSSSISKRFFSSQPLDEYTWKVHLSNLKPMDLNLTYAVGDTYIDLSDLPIERLKMNTGTANVIVNYKPGSINRIEMDTFLIKVDMGSMEAKNLHLSNSRNIIADVGFGTMKMDFAEAQNIKSDVRATVGAGSMEIFLPKEEIPVKIDINDSPLCRVKIPKGFVQTSANVFVSNGFDTTRSDYVNFSIDVAVGNIVFK
jgi:hypothetical protein